ncbi:hypothetical protein TWF569_011957 [Orbilia oligospora]|uniref:Uncharacterized protein n=1 Tax=Orbilia oligospora TaxID=2813651 RepID=A0A7C8JDH5_ORBOL|nr:hypothetical protein TWF706_012023 [Orbilia oligospora]KAF3094894.1 hypothetical protein TWF103_012026 [Orbilia oligospora]KAF3095542.1 hypothetical protein TWF102_012020 [Orbilia oligospora]KAF3134744.1 hypothetical protein TWF594_011882 [Orbilia oligospora]KAF3151135.1 hypothetical protein TWF569_011957 [Orbilia oligospora]
MWQASANRGRSASCLTSMFKSPSIFNLGSCFRTVQHTNDHSFGARIYITLIMKIEVVAAFEALRSSMEIFFHVIILSFISISKKCDAVCIYVY